MKIGFIGLGNMAKAVIEGLLCSGLATSADLLGSARTLATRQTVSEKYQMFTNITNSEVAQFSDTIVLAVKPQFLESVLEEIKDQITADKLVVSMAAGKTLSWLEARLPAGTRVVRIMPNTAAMVGESCTAVCKGAYATGEDVNWTVKMCQSFGVTQVIDESLMDVFGALGGSSGAFAFLYMEALADGAVAAGMPRKMAYEIAAQTTMGAGKLMRDTGEHPGILKDMVCSPGGTTIQGINALEQGGVRGSVMNAVEACVAKSRKL